MVGAEKENALDAVRAQDRESVLVVIKVAVVKGNQNPASGSFVFAGAVGKRECFPKCDKSMLAF